MLNKIIIVYLNFLLLVAGISVIFLAVESGDHQIIYAQVSISPEGYPEGHPLAPPQGSPQETSPGIPPNSQIPFDGSPDGIRGIPPNSQIPFDGSPDGIRGIPPNSQIPPSSQGTPTPPTNTQVPPTSSQPLTNTQVPPTSSQPLTNTQVPPTSSQPPIHSASTLNKFYFFLISGYSFTNRNTSKRNMSNLTNYVRS